MKLNIDPEEEKYNRQSWMSDDQWECMKFFRDYYRGFHHMRSNKVKECGTGIEYSHDGSKLATFDFSGLTELVLMSHQRFIRLQISPSGPGKIKLQLWKRKPEGQYYERHPSLTDLIKMAEDLKEQP